LRTRPKKKARGGPKTSRKEGKKERRSTLTSYFGKKKGKPDRMGGGRRALTLQSRGGGAYSVRGRKQAPRKGRREGGSFLSLKGEGKRRDSPKDAFRHHKKKEGEGTPVGHTMWRKKKKKEKRSAHSLNRKKKKKKSLGTKGRKKEKKSPRRGRKGKGGFPGHFLVAGGGIVRLPAERWENAKIPA